MMEIIIKIILTTALSWWICSFSPLQNVITLLFKDKQGILEQLLYKLLTCAKCNGFWLGMLMMNVWGVIQQVGVILPGVHPVILTIMLGAIVSVCSEQLYRKMQ